MDLFGNLLEVEVLWDRVGVSSFAVGVEHLGRDDVLVDSTADAVLDIERFWHNFVRFLDYTKFGTYKTSELYRGGQY